MAYSNDHMQIDSDTDDVVKDHDVDADGEYIDEDPMSAIKPPPQAPSLVPSYSRDSVCDNAYAPLPFLMFC